MHAIWKSTFRTIGIGLAVGTLAIAKTGSTANARSHGGGMRMGGGFHGGHH
jgi:hypothetical protein